MKKKARGRTGDAKKKIRRKRLKAGLDFSKHTLPTRNFNSEYKPSGQDR